MAASELFDEIDSELFEEPKDKLSECFAYDFEIHGGDRYVYPDNQFLRIEPKQCGFNNGLYLFLIGFLSHFMKKDYNFTYTVPIPDFDYVPTCECDAENTEFPPNTDEITITGWQFAKLYTDREYHHLTGIFETWDWNPSGKMTGLPDSIADNWQIANFIDGFHIYYSYFGQRETTETLGRHNSPERNAYILGRMIGYYTHEYFDQLDRESGLEENYIERTRAMSNCSEELSDHPDSEENANPTGVRTKPACSG